MSSATIGAAAMIDPDDSDLARTTDVGAALLADPVARVVSLALVPAGIYGFLAPFWCLPSAILRGVAAAAGIAFVNSFGNLGGLVGPYALGALKDATGSTTGALLGLAVMALAAAALCLVLRRQAGFAFQQRASGGALERAAVAGGAG